MAMRLNKLISSAARQLLGRIVIKREKNKLNSLRVAAYTKSNPNVVYERQLKRRYGISIADRQDLLVRQDNKCAICRIDENDLTTSRKRKLHVDHDHFTNVVRGLLCHYCNGLLGHAHDSITILNKAIVYLSRIPILRGADCRM